MSEKPTCPCMSIDDWLELEQLRKSNFKWFITGMIQLGMGTLYGVVVGLALVTYVFLPELAQSAEGARASGKASARSAGLLALPDGNHGENVSTGSGL